MTTPSDQSQLQDNPAGRVLSRDASRVEVSARRNRNASSPEGNRPAPFPEPPDDPPSPNRGIVATSGRQCWICFLTEEDDRSILWVNPCLCRGTMKWVHEICLQQWIDRRHAEDKSTVPFCPHCRTKYLIYYPDPGIFVRFLDLVDRLVDGACPYIVGTAVAGSLYWTALCVGATAFLEAGDTEAKDILENGNPLVLMTILPLIPAVIVGLGMLKWEDMALKCLRTITEYVPLTGYFLPTSVTNVSGLQQNRQISDGMVCTRVFAGASVLPLASKLCGDLLYSSVPSHFLRSLYGGLTFIGIKGLIIMFHKQQTYKRFSQRRILDRPQTAATTL